MPLSLMASDLGAPDVARQGNLDPLCCSLAALTLDRRIREICKSMRGRRFIFNLGHGILPPTPIEHVQRLVDIVRENGLIHANVTNNPAAARRYRPRCHRRCRSGSDLPAR